MKTFMGFLNGVARFSSRGVTACSKESNSKTYGPEDLEFMHITLKVITNKDRKGLWFYHLNMIMAAGAQVTRWNFHEDGRVRISGYFHRTRLLRNLERVGETLEVEDIQSERWASHNVSRKKEALSTKNTNPSTNNENPPTSNTNPPTNNTNTTTSYYQPQGFGSYYGNVGLSDNGGYANTDFYGSGGYNGNSYNYQPEPAVYQNNIGYDPSECSAHHNGKAVTPDETQDKFSENTSQRLQALYAA